MKVYNLQILVKFIVHNSKNQLVISLLLEVVEAMKLKCLMVIPYLSHVLKLEILAELALL
jgi:hypothetical protein